METIRNYLENMFNALPKTEEILKLKKELLSDMEEKYHELKSEGKTENEAIGIVITEFGNIDELLNELKIDIPKNQNNLPEVTLEEAHEFVYIKKKMSAWIGAGVVLCIIGAASLILLSQLIEDHLILQTVSTNIKDVLPISSLLVIIVPAVAIFIYSGTKTKRYQYIDDGAFYTSSMTESLLREKHASLPLDSKIAIIVGVCLCILSPISIFMGEALWENGSTYGLCILLLIVSVAVFLFIYFGSTEDAYKKLIKTEEYSPVQKKSSKVIGAVASVVWPVAVCIFLLWGFLFRRWDISWIVFPITGILFGAFSSVYTAMKGNSK